MASKEMVFILNDVFMNPIDKNIERFLSSKLISDDDLISKLSYESASHSIVAAARNKTQ